MSKVYKIHPAIGFARVGRSDDSFFLVGEEPGARPFELDANGNETAFRGYKDASHIIRRQGVRFKVFEYEKVGADEKLLREITASDATIEWTIRVVAAKAAVKEMRSKKFTDGVRTLFPSNVFRNSPPTGFTRDDLIASVDLKASGRNDVPSVGTTPKGRFLGKEIFLGEARTDASGRLVFLAGWGDAWTWTTPPKPMKDFLNNPGWYDDIGDGTVDAVVTFPDGTKVDPAGAWVCTTPPDFAPEIAPLTSLYDIAEQTIQRAIPNPLSYPLDVEPILRRAANLFFVNELPGWKNMHNHLENPTGLDDNSPELAATRNKVKSDLFDAQLEMNSFRLTDRQRTIIERWAVGDFQSTTDTSRRPLNAAEMLDKSNLERCAGGGFFPGIEASTTLRQPTIYSEFARLTRGEFTDMDGSTVAMQAGLLSSRMACPWHADFMECNTDWWPTQRPDIAGRKADGSSRGDWADGLIVDSTDTPESHQNMVDHFSQLGVVVRNGDMFEQTGRDPALDAGV